MKPWQHLVVTVADPFIRRQMGVKKAATIAARCNARITLFHAFSLPYPLPNPAPSSSSEALKIASEAHYKALEQLAKPLRKHGLTVECVVEWDFPAHEAIVRHVLKHKPDLLIAESHRHGKIARWLLTNTDWELIRACPCPLWFVKTPALPATVSVLAAVDPLHAHAKPAQLDVRILDAATALTAQLGGRLNLAHAYTAPLTSPDALSKSLRSPMPQDRARLFQTSIAEQVKQLASRYDVPDKYCFIKEGDPVAVISSLAQQKKISVVAMGAVSRSGLKRSFVGNTAEKLIDQLRCDLLIVKPNDFRTSVRRQDAASRLHMRG